MKLGSQRHCKEGRAEAIMSVIRATGWFIEAPRTGTLRELEKDLVLGLYPILFLRETAEMLGARFYTSIVIRTDIDEDFSRILDIRGSLLPFNTHSQDNGQTFEEICLPRWQFSEGDHPSVKLWSIEADGSVSIPEAAVLVPASHHEVMPLIASVIFAYPMDSGLYQKLGPAGRKGDRNRSIDLREWEKNWLPFSRNYAVALINVKFLERDYVREILLKETRSGALVKIGFFTTRGLFEEEGAMTRMIPVRSVDWRVL
ncbi:hypothetical protein HO133_000631 [Letharia lupina]|uniref:Uncharacterized protein n=1 Tax=Letharia lupina TaxID=560253 RepID=A0A8H6CFG9_9LECA|nr:uncharacterized protein HO133_000631 [Letharia lupina]KAF6222585.1 hypothetical protein HO133_000631 [Letharia lupina]